MGNKKMTALLLCGGKSTRMGVNKQKLSYNGVYLIDTIIENLAKNFDQIIILSNEKDFFENRYKNYKNDILIKEDIIKNIGPCAGLYSGLIYAKNEDNFLIACDMPYFNQAYIDFLKEKSYEKILAYKNEKYFEPFFALYKKELAKDLEKYIKKGGRSLNGFLREISPTVIKKEEVKDIKNFDKIFKNLNYPDDWKKFIEESKNEFS